MDGGAPLARLSLKQPEQCLHCGASSSVRLQHTLKGDAVELLWCCAACDEGWAVAETDAASPERRGAADGRRDTGKERRSKGQGSLD